MIRTCRCVALLLTLSLGLAACEDDDGPPADPTSGCGQDPGLPTGQWVERSVTAGGTSRVYFVWLPEGYDPDRAYPVVYQFHGCSDDRETNNVPVQSESGDDAIHVRGRAIERCWEYDTGTALFDAMVPQIEADFCVDASRRFATGYSSGSFLAHHLACVRGDLLRGVATIAGGQAGSSCVGQVAALLIHDEDDTTVDIAQSEAARDRYLAANGCDLTAAPIPTEPPPCVRYVGCATGFPVVWCQTSGQSHARQDSLAAPAFWNFLSAL